MTAEEVAQLKLAVRFRNSYNGPHCFKTIMAKEILEMLD